MRELHLFMKNIINSILTELIGAKKPMKKLSPPTKSSSEIVVILVIRNTFSNRHHRAFC